MEQRAPVGDTGFRHDGVALLVSLQLQLQREQLPVQLEQLVVGSASWQWAPNDPANGVVWSS